MTISTFLANIPQPDDELDFSQPQLLANNGALDAIFGKDHVQFSNTTSAQGEHKQVTFNGNNVPGSAPSDPSSYLFTQSGVASSHAQLYYQNADIAVPVNAIRAFGRYAVASLNTPVSALNVQSVTKSSTGVYLVTLSSGAVSNANFAVTISCTSPLLMSYQVTGSGTFTLTFTSTVSLQPSDPTGFSFQVLQV